MTVEERQRLRYRAEFDAMLVTAPRNRRVQGRWWRRRRPVGVEPVHLTQAGVDDGYLRFTVGWVALLWAVIAASCLPLVV